MNDDGTNPRKEISHRRPSQVQQQENQKLKLIYQKYNGKVLAPVVKRKTQINATADPVKLEINAIKSAKRGIKIAESRVTKLDETRMLINQTKSCILQENESGETDSSIVWIIVITQKGYKKLRLKVKMRLQGYV